VQGRDGHGIVERALFTDDEISVISFGRSPLPPSTTAVSPAISPSGSWSLSWPGSRPTATRC
jgi:hypothetical protein